MNNKIIAIIDPLGNHVGFHYYVNNQAEALSSLGHSVFVYGYNNASEQATNYIGVDAFHNLYGNEPKWQRGLRMFGQIFAAVLSARRRNAQFILMHLFKYEVIEAFTVGLSRLLGLKIITVLHDIERIDKQEKHDFSKYIIGNSTVILVHNEFSKRKLLSNKPAGSAVVVVAHHGHYLSQFTTLPSQTTARTKLAIPADQIVLLFFGVPRPLKGLHLLIEALGKFPGQDFLLLIAGTMKPDYEQEIRRLIMEAGITDRVRIDSGRVADEDVAFYYRAADIVILPYLEVYESGVALMAMSLGRTVLTSDLEPFTDLVGDESRGLVFKAGSVEALADRLRGIFEKKNDLDAMSANAFEFVRDNRDWASAARALDCTIQAL